MSRKTERAMAFAVQTASDTSNLVKNEAGASLRQSVTSLFNLATSFKTYRFPTKQLIDCSDVSSDKQNEQIWRQLSANYYAVIGNLEKYVSACENLPERVNEETAKQQPQTQRLTAGRSKTNISYEPLSNDSDDDGGLIALKQQHKKPRTKKPAKAGLNPFVFGKEDDDDAANAEDAFRLEGDPDGQQPRRKKRARSDAAPTADEEKALFEEDDNFGDDGDHDEGEDEENEDLGEVAMAELYGDDDIESNGDDFFDSEIGDDDTEDLTEGAHGDDTSTTFNPFSGVDGEEDEEEEEPEDDPTMTAFKRSEMQRLQAIRDAEDERLLGPHWSMMGEVAAKSRPKDSLIETAVTFEHGARPVPEITERVTQALELRIKQRIKNNNFDDVERRVLKTSAADLQTTKRDTEIDAQKSKLSLMDLYEKDYLEKQRRFEQNGETAEPLTEIEKDELKALHMWQRLSQHLDALSNFYFTPPPSNRDTSARERALEGSAPAVAVEAVGTQIAAAEVLAPQDHYRPNPEKRLQGVAPDEMSPAERRGLRRAKKDVHSKGVDRHERQTAANKKQQQQQETSKS